MKCIPLLISTALMISLASCQDHVSHDTTEKPNILLVMTDDQGYGDIGFHGNPYIKTPFLDSLAGMSTRFNQFYTTPVCAPTRAGLMTGRYALRTGVYDTYMGGAIMHSDEVTIAEILRDAGYQTAIFGKWHLGDHYPSRTIDQGFTTSLVNHSGGIGEPSDYFENYMRPDSCYFNPYQSKNGVKVKTEGYCSDVYTDAAIEFLEKQLNEDSPFFIFLSFNAPHTPLQVPGEYLEIYQDMVFSPDDFPHAGLLPEMKPRHREDAKRVYAMMTNIDDNLRSLFNRLDKLNELDNTLVIFLSDNGPQQPRYNAGLNGRKESVLEGGIRVPCFWYWKKKFPSDFEIQEVASNLDVLPTLLDICNINPPPGLAMDGISLLPLINKEVETLPERAVFFEWDRGYPQPYSNIAVRKGDYKLVGTIDYHVDPDGLQLYNIASDPYELTDISNEYPEIINQLKTDFDHWYNEIMNSKNLVHPPRIILGSNHQNPSILGRHDWKGPKTMHYEKAEAFGYWDVTFNSEGLYDITLIYKNNFNTGGRAYIRAGTVQRSIENHDTATNKITFTNVPINKGDFMFEAWYRQGVWGKNYAPLYVEIFRKEQ